MPSGHYASFEAKGDPAQVIWRTWVHVNTECQERGRRRYIADYERYTAMEPGPLDAHVVVGVA